MITYYGKSTWFPSVTHICPPTLQQIIITVLLIHSHIQSTLHVLPKHVVVYVILKYVAESDDYLYGYYDGGWDKLFKVLYEKVAEKKM